jgi:hypothetical protein
VSISIATRLLDIKKLVHGQKNIYFNK